MKMNKNENMSIDIELTLPDISSKKYAPLLPSVNVERSFCHFK